MSNLFFREGGLPGHTGMKVMLATPAYDSPDSAYVEAIERSQAALKEVGIESAYLLLQGNCHVDDARNNIVRQFLASNCTHLLFIDADVNWDMKGLLRLTSRKHCDIVGGVYPYRRKSENFPVRIMNERQPDDTGLLEVEGLPTGFMMISRSVLATLAETAIKYWEKNEQTALLFERTVGENGTRWGGDINFCNRAKAEGFKLWADCEIRLGHVTKIIHRDGLGAYLRRHADFTLEHVVGRVREGTAQPDVDYEEIFDWANNPFAADPGVLALVTGAARQTRGPIIEAGSGLSTILMAAANPENEVFSLEHDDTWAQQTYNWVKRLKLTNVNIACLPLDPETGWYQIEKFELPEKFALGFCDGPPRKHANRGHFFDRLAHRCAVVIADDVADDIKYGMNLDAWAQNNDWSIQLEGRAAILQLNSRPREQVAA
jgi:predicted O-methyltransferase YrrM